jgi:hypothetical protein
MWTIWQIGISREWLHSKGMVALPPNNPLEPAPMTRDRPRLTRRRSGPCSVEEPINFDLARMVAASADALGEGPDTLGH